MPCDGSGGIILLKGNSDDIRLARATVDIMSDEKAQQCIHRNFRDIRMKIYISVDMEGVAGVVSGEQLRPDGFEYQRFREFMTSEVNAAIGAAIDCGVSEIVISDSHGNGQNLLIEHLSNDVQLVRSWPRPLMMMEGIDETFAGAILLGYHTGAANCRGVRSHTMSSARLTEIKLNGTSMSEAGINAAIAGYFGVPVIAVTGDDATAEETVDLLGDVETAVVKESIGFHSAKMFSPARAREVISESVKKAITRIDTFKPFVLEPPINLELSFQNIRPAELLSYLPIVSRTGSRSVTYLAKDMIEVSKFIGFALSYDSSLEP